MTSVQCGVKHNRMVQEPLKMGMKHLFIIVSKIALHTTTKANFTAVDSITVIMGSRGPNISSVMTSESRGTSSKMVGLILLHLNKRKPSIN